MGKVFADCVVAVAKEGLPPPLTMCYNYWVTDPEGIMTTITLNNFYQETAKVFRQIDIEWQEVANIVIQGLAILIVGTYYLGLQTRRAIDFAADYLADVWVAAIATDANVAVVPAYTHPLYDMVAELETMTQRQLMKVAGVRSRKSKKDLINIILAAV